MSPYKIMYDGVEWKTTEALFQALRFNDPKIRDEIRACPSPMGAKMIAKRNAAAMVIKPMSTDDVDNMRLCLQLKLDQHPSLKVMLKDTGDEDLVEDVSSRMGRASSLFWGAAVQNGELVGENVLGRLWACLRSKL